MKPKTAVAMLACKLHIDNARAKTRIGKMLKTQDKALTVEHERVWKGCDSLTNKPEEQAEEVNAMMIERKLTIRNEKQRAPTTKNVTLIDEAVSYVKTKGSNKETSDQENQQRLHKKVILPVELVGATGRL